MLSEVEGDLSLTLTTVVRVMVISSESDVTNRGPTHSSGEAVHASMQKSFCLLMNVS